MNFETETGHHRWPNFVTVYDDGVCIHIS